jgi:lipopolysaccharide export system protein LptA
MNYREIKPHIRDLGKGMFFLFLLFMLKNGEVWGQDDGLSYTASDSIVMIADSNLVRLYGDVKVTSGDIELTADRVVYKTDLKEACAYGTQDSLGNWTGRPIFKQARSIVL